MLQKTYVTLMVGLLLLSGGVFAQSVLERSIAMSSDDAEEFLVETSEGPAGLVYLDSSDLELMHDGDIPQVVGLRFSDITLPADAVIQSAVIEFMVDRVSDEPTSITIAAEASANAETFRNDVMNISGRALTTASVTWQPDAWTERRSVQTTPDVTGLITEVISQADWRSGNAIAFIFQGEGYRNATSFDGREKNAARLVITYTSETEMAATSETQTADNSTPEDATQTPETPTTDATETTDSTDADASPAPAEATEPVTETPTTADTTTPENSSMDANVTTDTSGTDASTGTKSAQVRATLEAINSTTKGSILLADFGDGSSGVTILIDSMPADATYGASLHMGSCENDGDMLLALNNVDGKQGGLSISITSIPYSTFVIAGLHVNIYDNVERTGQRIACGAVGGLN